jgi:hypothetical protein
MEDALLNPGAPRVRRVVARVYRSARSADAGSRSCPVERTWEDSELYRQWQIEHAFLLVPAQAFAAKFLASFKDFPQRQKVGSFNLDKVVQQMLSASQNLLTLSGGSLAGCGAPAKSAAIAEKVLLRLH